jgi:RimJ/RimL family protein N-acetyltransferase
MWSLIHGSTFEHGDEKLAAWAANRIPVLPDGFGACRAIGVATGETEHDKMLAVIVYHGFSAGLGFCEVSIAADNPRWAQRGVIRALLSVPFDQFRCRKLYGTILSTNHRACKLISGLGFKKEAVLRHHFGKSQHAAVFGLMAHEYRAKWSS